MLYPYKNTWEIYNIVDIVKTIFLDYPEVINWIIFKIFALSQDKMIFADFLDKLKLINDDILSWNIDEESQKLLINKLNSIIQQYDKIRNFKNKMEYVNKKENNNENIEDIFNNFY